MSLLRKFLSASALKIGCGTILIGENVMAGGAIASISLLLWPWRISQDSQTGNTQNLENKANMEPLDKAKADYAVIQRNIGISRTRQ